MEGLIQFTGIVMIVFGILQIILFFKIWGMTNNVKRIWKKIDNKDFLSDACVSYIKGNLEETERLANEAFLQEVALLSKSSESYEDWIDNYIKIKEKYFVNAIEEYSKRLSRYVTLNIAEVPDEKAPENMSLAQMEQVKNIEGQRLMKVFKDSYVVALAINGKSLTSEGLADFITQTTLKGVSHITFVIGGSLGLSDEVLNRADYKLSFSAMTFPHQLMRVILLEQIYRANRIIKNEPYHK